MSVKDNLAALAWELWGVCGFRRGLPGEEVTGLIREGYQDGVLLAATGTPDGQVMLQGLIRWAWEGYPTLVLGHKYAAALLATQTSREAMQAVEAPWEGFMIEVPNGLLSVFDPEYGREVDVRRLIVSKIEHMGGEKRWAWIAITETYVTLWRYGVVNEDLLPGTLTDNAWDGSPLMLDLTDRDERANSLIGRLILHTCLAIQDGTLVREIGPGHRIFKDVTRKGSRPSAPVLRTFQVGKGIILDLREAVRNYLLHGAKLQIRSYVNGHWKMQPYGPQQALRKPKWIEPYGRGPDVPGLETRP